MIYTNLAIDSAKRKGGNRIRLNDMYELLGGIHDFGHTRKTYDACTFMKNRLSFWGEYMIFGHTRNMMMRV